jgi:hypothetical protein
MSDSDLSNQYIDDTFDGLLHMQGDPLPSSGVGIVYDGVGNKSALSLGRQGVGVTITGNLSSDTLNVGALEYPSTAGNENALLYQESSKKIGRLDKGDLSNEYLMDLNPNPAGTYSGSVINKLKVNSKGLVTLVSLSEDPPDDDTDPDTEHKGTIGVSRTYYLKKPIKIANNITINATDDGYTTITTSSVVPTTAKAILGYVSIYSSINSARVALATTHDYTIATNRWNLICNGKADDTSQICGNQFHALLASNRSEFYVANVEDVDKLINQLDRNTLNSPAHADIWIIGYQE